jgi:hypothetical protein
MSHLLAVKNIETYYGLVYAIRGRPSSWMKAASPPS